MDRFVKNFIAMSIVYLALASILGVIMFAKPSYLGAIKFPHSHLMLLGWVSMMIYGVGYHILPRFAGKMIKSALLAEIQFWMSNIGLIGMVVFYPFMQYNPDMQVYRILAVFSGVLEAVSILAFLYNIMITVYGNAEGG